MERKGKRKKTKHSELRDFKVGRHHSYDQNKHK